MYILRNIVPGWWTLHSSRTRSHSRFSSPSAISPREPVHTAASPRHGWLLNANAFTQPLLLTMDCSSSRTRSQRTASPHHGLLLLKNPFTKNLKNTSMAGKGKSFRVWCPKIRFLGILKRPKCQRCQTPMDQLRFWGILRKPKCQRCQTPIDPLRFSKNVMSHLLPACCACSAKREPPYAQYFQEGTAEQG